MTKSKINCHFSSAQLQQFVGLAITAAKQAGEYIAAYPREQLKVEHKSQDLSLSAQVVTEVDRHCERIILNTLKPITQLNQLATLAEENTEGFDLTQHPRFSSKAFWAIDPLDGTLPFIEGGDGYAVSIALVNKAGQALLGVCYLPFSNKLYHSYFNPDSQQHHSFKQQLAFEQKTPSNICDLGSTSLTFYCDRSSLKLPYFEQLKAQLEQLAKHLGYSELLINSSAGAVVNACSVIDESNALYLKLAKRTQGGGCIWDFAASSCIAQGCNAWVSDSYGQALELNNSTSSFMNQKGVLYASNATLAKQVLALKLNEQFSDA
ncbi:3'(2'),5'-bisphosphate nucleotidase CysQ family protein [Agarivorans albus]|uniref:Inositol-1-monophosphatase n=1 Tax=Agarivorans albus MKT 106 TaxID=1331007 RepID=R9PNQ5_AGAAL|nr:inositol monophosphatase family protein [Agarivorans albus]GAD02984.1 inositol-1-monophosphatase [Agarivorans albus MKT 106]